MSAEVLLDGVRARHAGSAGLTDKLILRPFAASERRRAWFVIFDRAPRLSHRAQVPIQLLYSVG